MSDTGRRTGAPDGTCKRCAADLVWAWVLGAKGRRVPLDVDPTAIAGPAGSVPVRYATSLDPLRRLRARQLDPGERPGPGERLAVSHLAVCRVLVERREARASLRAAKAAAPNPYDPEALREARQQAAR